MKFKKIFSGVISLAILGSVLTGCASSVNETANTSNSNSDTSVTSSKENISTDESISGKLVVWEHTTDYENALIELIENFQAIYPNVEVEYEIKSDQYYSLLATSIQAGEAPDLFWTNGTATAQMAEYVSQGACLDITDSVDMSELEEDAFGLVTIDGVKYSVPWMTFDTRACYYDIDMFEEMGLEVPTTFSEFEALLPIFQENGKVPIALSGMSSWPILFFIEPLAAAMEPEYTRGLEDYSSKANDERFGNALEKMLEWADKGYFGEGWLGVDDDGASLAFTTGQAAMYVGGTWCTTSLQENNPDLNLGAFLIPSEEGTKGMVGTYANGFSIYSGTKNKEAALAFLNYCATLEAQTNWVQTLGPVSGSPKIEPSNEVSKKIADCDEIFISWQSNLSKYNKEGESATSVWEEESTKVASKAITVQQLLDDLGEVMQ